MAESLNIDLESEQIPLTTIGDDDDNVAIIIKTRSSLEAFLVHWASITVVILAITVIFLTIWIIVIQARALANVEANHGMARRCMESLAASNFSPECHIPIAGISSIATLLRNRWIHMIGESSARDLFHTLKAMQFDGALPGATHHGDHTDQAYRAGSSLATLRWAPFLAEFPDALPPNQGVFSRPDLLYISLGLHDILYRQEALEASAAKFVEKLERIADGRFLVAVELPGAIDRARLPPTKAEAAHFDNTHIEALSDLLMRKLAERGIPCLLLQQHQKDPFPDQEDGIHSQTKSSQSARRLLQIVYWLNEPITRAPFSPLQFALVLLSVPILAIALWLRFRTFFSTCAADSVALRITSMHPTQAIATKIAFFAVPTTIMKALEASAILATVLGCVYLTDGPRPLAVVAHKPRNGTALAALYAILLVVAIAYRRPIPSSMTGDRAVLNRLQTEEWKGMMQVAFIWYHLFNVSSTYNLIRVFVTSYVWMTGFGNFIFFQSKKDFSLLRILKTLFRLNFLVAMLCLVLDRQWMLYYICPLHTVFFLVVWLIARYPPRQPSPRIAIAKAAASVLALAVFFQIPDLFETVFASFGGLFLRNGSMAEWRFRAQLDAYSTAIGIVAASLLPSATSLLNDLNGKTCLRRRITYTAGFLGVLIAWMAIFYPMEKSLYNTLHPYLGFIPMLAYIGLRNLFPAVRHTYLPLFQLIGTITLETYLLQLHLYMSHDAKMMIVYFSSSVIANFLLGTVVFVLASLMTFRATGAINDFLFPSAKLAVVIMTRILPMATAISAGLMIDAILRLTTPVRS